MPAIINSWVEKVLKKKKTEAAPSYEKKDYKDDFKWQTRRPEKRHTSALKVAFTSTLRGIRK